MNIQFPETIQCGVQREGYDTFDDSHHLKQPNKVQSIKISVGEGIICGIQFTYMELQNGKQIHGHNSCHSDKTIKEYIFQIPDNDFLQVIFGYFEGSITQLGFITYRGKTAIFGYERGVKFTHLHMGHTYTAAFGCYKHKQLDQLGLRLVKLPKIYIENNFPPLIEIIYREQRNPYENLSTFGVQKDIIVDQQQGFIPPQPVAVQSGYQTETFEQQQYPQQQFTPQLTSYSEQQQMQQNQYQQQQQQQYNQYNQQQSQFVPPPPPPPPMMMQGNNMYNQPNVNMYNQPMYNQPRPQEIIVQNQYGQKEVIIEQPYQQRPPQQTVIVEQTPYGPKEVIVANNNPYGQNNNVVIVNEQQQYQQQRQGMGIGGALLMGALTADVISHDRRRHENIVVVEGHHHHGRR